MAHHDPVGRAALGAGVDPSGLTDLLLRLGLLLKNRSRN